MDVAVHQAGQNGYIPVKDNLPSCREVSARTFHHLDAAVAYSDRTRKLALGADDSRGPDYEVEVQPSISFARGLRATIATATR